LRQGFLSGASTTTKAVFRPGKKGSAITMIEFNNVSKIYPNGTKALRDMNIKINKGEFVFVVGSSGAGKSTFLKLMMREETPSSGEIIVNGINLNNMKKREVPHFRRTLGVVFQDFRLIPSMKVFDNVAFAMRVIGAKEKDISKRVAYTLSLVGLSSKARMYPTQLSGGEQQRVAMARALVNNADIIIADEPTGNVDPEMSYEIVDLLNHINANGTTVIMVTHEHNLVKQFDKRVITIQGGNVVSDTTDMNALNMQPCAVGGEPGTVPCYYDAPNEHADIEEFLKTYGTDEEKASVKHGSKKERRHAAETPKTEEKPSFDIRNLRAVAQKKDADYSVYFEPSEEKEQEGDQ
jgi:cell division transport system ATP-binding protein